MAEKEVFQAVCLQMKGRNVAAECTSEKRSNSRAGQTLHWRFSVSLFLFLFPPQSGGVIIESDHHQSPAFTEGGFCSPSERRHQNTSAKYFQQYLCAVVHLQTYMIV